MCAYNCMRVWSGLLQVVHNECACVLHRVSDENAFIECMNERIKRITFTALFTCVLVLLTTFLNLLSNSVCGNFFHRYAVEMI